MGLVGFFGLFWGCTGTLRRCCRCVVVTSGASVFYGCIGALGYWCCCFAGIVGSYCVCVLWAPVVSLCVHWAGIAGALGAVFGRCGYDGGGGFGLDLRARWVSGSGFGCGSSVLWLWGIVCGCRVGLRGGVVCDCCGLYCFGRGVAAGGHALVFQFPTTLHSFLPVVVALLFPLCGFP